MRSSRNIFQSNSIHFTKMVGIFVQTPAQNLNSVFVWRSIQLFATIFIASLIKTVQNIWCFVLNVNIYQDDSNEVSSKHNVPYYTAYLQTRRFPWGTTWLWLYNDARRPTGIWNCDIIHIAISISWNIAPVLKCISMLKLGRSVAKPRQYNA